MKKLLLIAALIVALMFPILGGAVELNNITSRGVDGNLVFYDVSGNAIMTLDAANRKLSFPSGSLLETLGTTITIGNISYTVPTNNGAASQFLQTDGDGVLTWAGGASTAWDAIGDATAAGTVAMTTYAQILTSTKTDGDMFNIQGLGAFGDVSVVRIEQKTGLATDGTVLEVVSADADVDALLVTANATDIIQVYGSGAIKINSLEFDVSETTGSITINDGGDLGQISIEGTVLDINSLDFVGAGAITAAASSAITINPNAGNAAGEDLIITAHNIQLTAEGAITMSPDAAVTTALTITDTDYTNALSVGDNAILGTTGVITYSNWSINADGDFAGVDATFTGAVNVGIWKQDAVVASTATTTITVDGTTTGGVTIGGTSEGTITLGKTGGTAATLVNLPASVDLVLVGGDLTVTDTENADMVTFTNNTMTTADLVTLSASGTRTSDNVIEIVDGATTATTIGITATTMTSGDGIRYTNAGAGILTGAAFVANVTGAFTGYYFLGESAGTDEFTVKKNGATVIAGAASTDMLTITAGDLQITAGDIDLDLGFITVDNTADEANYIKRNFNGAGTAAMLTIEDTHASADKATLNIVSNGSAATALKIDQTGTGNAIALDINAAGDLPVIDIDASAARTGDVINVLMTNQEAERGLVFTGAWTGTNAEGLIDLYSSAKIVAGASMLRIDNDTAQASDSATGYMLNIDDDTLVATTPTVYAVSINSNANGALSVSKGISLFTDAVTFTAMSVHNGGLDVNEDVDIDFDANDEEVSISTSAEIAAASSGLGLVTIASTLADVTTTNYLLKLQYVDDDDANADFFVCTDDSGVNDDELFKIAYDGSVTAAGNLALTGKATIGGMIVNTPMTFAFTTEANITDPLTSTVVLLDGDDDADNDAIDLQNGTTAGQIVIFIAAVEIDASDTCTIAMTDTTCTNCPAIVFDAVGESATLVWTGTTWVVTSLRQ